jgi:hypothetical protein
LGPKTKFFPPGGSEVTSLRLPITLRQHLVL